MSDARLTAKEAYLAMYAFLDLHYRRSGLDDLGVLLGGMSLLGDGSPADPSAWTAWEAAVVAARTRSVDADLHLASSGSLPEISIEYPPGFDDHAWEVEAKGWLACVAVIAGRRYPLTVYEPVRLAQEIGDALERHPVFLEPNLVVVPSVTPESITAAVSALVRSRRLGELVPEAEDNGHEGPPTDQR